LVIVVVKMVYGLDGQKRIPTEEDQFAWYFPPLDKWLLMLQERNANKFQRDFPWNWSDWQEYSQTYPDQYIKIAAQQIGGQRKTPSAFWRQSSRGEKRAKQLNFLFRKLKIDKETAPNLETEEPQSDEEVTIETGTHEKSARTIETEDDGILAVQENIQRLATGVVPSSLCVEYQHFWEQLRLHQQQASETNNSAASQFFTQKFSTIGQRYNAYFSQTPPDIRLPEDPVGEHKKEYQTFLSLIAEQLCVPIFHLSYTIRLIEYELVQKCKRDNIEITFSKN